MIPAALLFTSSGVQRLETGGTIVGAFSDAEYLRGETRLSPGDLVVLFSDGVVEAEDPQGCEFGDRGIIDAVAAVRDRAPTEILAAVLDAVRTFTRGAPLRDDLTAMVVQYR